MRLAAGKVFGESCIEGKAEDAVRKANVVAVGPVVVLKLTAATFTDLMGSVADVIAYNFKRKQLESVTIEDKRIFDVLPYADQETFLEKLTEKSFEEGKDVI